MRSRIRQGPRRERLLMVATSMSLLMVVILLTMLLLLIGLMLIFVTHARLHIPLVMPVHHHVLALLMPLTVHGIWVVRGSLRNWGTRR